MVFNNSFCEFILNGLYDCTHCILIMLLLRVSGPDYVFVCNLKLLKGRMIGRTWRDRMKKNQCSRNIPCDRLSEVDTGKATPVE